MKHTIIVGALTLVFAVTGFASAQVPPPRPLPQREILMKLQREHILQLERLMRAMEKDLEFGMFPIDPLQFPIDPFLQPNQ